MHSVSGAAAQRVRPMRTWGTSLAPLAGAPLPGQGCRCMSYRLNPGGEPADDLRQREEGGDEVAVYAEAAD